MGQLSSRSLSDFPRSSFQAVRPFALPPSITAAAALGLLNAEERVAAFLLNLSRRYAERGYSGTKFLLRMTRAEIGGFLGLSLETVSRILSQLQRDRVLSVDRREIGILNMSALLAIGTNRPLH